MTILIEIVCSVSQAEAAQTAVEALNKERGGQLIGRRSNGWTHKVTLIVQLSHTVDAHSYAISLSHARQQNVIESFRHVTSDLVQISLHPSMNLRDAMRDFPLRSQESWFPAIHDAQLAYVSLSMPVMSAKQAAWLLAHEVEWSFV